jgi:hypothetical protein
MIDYSSRIYLDYYQETYTDYYYSINWCKGKNTFLYSSFISNICPEHIYKYLKDDKCSNYFIILILKNSKMVNICNDY